MNWLLSIDRTNSLASENCNFWLFTSLAGLL